MIKFFKNIFFLTIFSMLVTNSYAHERIANSNCNILINKIIDNYELIKNHYYVSYVDDIYGFLLEKTWDSTLIEENDDGTKTIGKSKFRRDKDGNIFFLNVFPTYVSKVNFRPGDKIIKINNLPTKNYSDEEIDKVFEDKENKVQITYINSQNQKINEVLETHKESVITKYLDFKIKNFNSINNRTFETEFLINYQVSSEMYDGIIRDKIEMQDDNLFNMIKNVFYNKDPDGTEWYGSCYYTDDEINQMQLYSPGWDFKLSNLSFKSEDTSETLTYFDIYDEISGYDFESIDFVSSFNGQIKIKNKFDLRNFPFDKQRIIFQFSEVNSKETLIRPYDSLYSNLDMLMNNKNLINGWKLVDYRVSGENYQEQRFYQDAYLNGLNIILEIERESSYYVYKIILPIVLILMVCWSVMWISPKELEARLTVTIVCLLSLIAYNFVIDSEIPKLEYLTIMDWIIFLSYIFATIPNFLCIISSKLLTTNKNLCFSIENKAKYFGPLTYIVMVILIITYNINAVPENSVQALKILAR